MKKDPDQNSTDFAEIEALITRIERGQLRDGDAQSLARLLRLLLRLITLLQLPAGVKPEKYDETCDVSLALAKY